MWMWLAYKVSNEEVLARLNESRTIVNSIWQKKLRWTGYILRYHGLLYEIIDGRMTGKPTGGGGEFTRWQRVTVELVIASTLSAGKDFLYRGNNTSHRD